jgi:copper(I)-binding protein
MMPGARWAPPLALLLGACAGHADRLASGRFEIPLVIVVAPVLDGTPAVLYATFANGTSRADTLIAVTVPVADSATLHQMVTRGAGMVMSPLASLPIAAHHEVRLQPGGYHVMLEGLRAKLVPGDSLPVTFRFAVGGDTTVLARIVRYRDLEQALQDGS